MSSIPHYKYLVVEDESLIRKNLIKKITSLDLPLTLIGEAANGMEAIVKVEKDCPDLVITDIRMPQCDGLELSRYLHKNHPGVKIIILSGYDDFSYAQAAIKFAVRDYLLKPVTAQALSESLQKLLEEHDLRSYAPVLLTGSTRAKEKREIYEKIAAGEAKMIIGTHALIQEKVEYQSLALVITDEQHRFGVRQRITLSDKGKQPNVLVMSATPIPRTLAIILYGDLDISVVDELPAKRLPIKNCVVDTSYRPNAYRFMEREIAAGHQVYVICPMVEESEGMEAENVTDYTQKLREVFPPSITVEALHGQMKPAQKNEIMEQFAANEIQVLVSTTVVEVGVNVPNATVMMGENAERFGLAQLHQLRGRVGRGDAQSYCIFMQGSGAKETSRRLEILNKSNDGFFIASEDLKLRGPGDLFGVRQSGLMEFAIADIYRDAPLLKQASDAARELLELDPDLSLPQNQKLKERLDTYSRRRLEDLGL